MYFYRIGDKKLLSFNEYPDLERVKEADILDSNGLLYFLRELEPSKSRRSFCVSDTSLLFATDEGIGLLQKPINENQYYGDIPQWLLNRINNGQLVSVNTAYPTWKDVLSIKPSKRWKLNVIGLGDVGGTLVTGLRLLGSELISTIGIYGRNKNTINRWIHECNQILPAFSEKEMPEVVEVSDEELFDCDMFVFCASAGVPPVGQEVSDVRLAQLEGNAKIIAQYARAARQAKFKGIFAVVSDPVDLLAKVVFNESNKNDGGVYDYQGLGPEQIRGYGLGVMHGRAVFYSKQSQDTLHYPVQGRAFGPHGRGLIIADSIENYNQGLSLYLTEKAQNANLAVRATGHKPYIAPALSSGSLSIISTIAEEWHYSSIFMGGVFMGCKNRLLKSGTEIERLDLHPSLVERLEETFRGLDTI